MAIEHHEIRAATEDTHGTDLEAWMRAFRRNLYSFLGRFPVTATTNDKYQALAYSVREHLLDRWVKTAETYYRNKARTVCYLSAEFLLGPHLGNNLVNLGAVDTVKQAIEALGLDFEELVEQEEEPGLGNGGLGRLAPAISTRSQRFRFHRSAMGSVMSSAFSTSRSVTDGKWR